MNFDKPPRQPSLEEVEQIEAMTPRQKELSESREQGYKLAESKHQKTQTKENGSDKSYREEKIINGIEIKVRWYDVPANYEIYFPQIKTGDDASQKGVFDQTIRLSEKREVAEKVFEYASKLAESESDVYEIYKKVENFSMGLESKE